MYYLKLKDLQLYKELNDKYYLSAVFEQEDETGFYEISVPKIDLEIDASGCYIKEDKQYVVGQLFHTVTVDFGGIELNARPSWEDKSFYNKKLISEKIHEMTLEEIEKELGYKIKLKENKYDRF